jgi:hypothetical protein
MTGVWKLEVLLVFEIFLLFVGCTYDMGYQTTNTSDTIIETELSENENIDKAVELEIETEVPEPIIEPSPELSRNDINPTFSSKSINPQVNIPMPNTTIVPEPYGPVESNIIQLAKEDLTDKLKVDLNEIELLEYALVTWGDSSLGCPQPGMRYKQVPVDGYLIRLAYQEQAYNYHGSGSKGPFLCE